MKKYIILFTLLFGSFSFATPVDLLIEQLKTSPIQKGKYKEVYFFELLENNKKGQTQKDAVDSLRKLFPAYLNAKDIFLKTKSISHSKIVLLDNFFQNLNAYFKFLKQNKVDEERIISQLKRKLLYDMDGLMKNSKGYIENMVALQTLDSLYENIDSKKLLLEYPPVEQDLSFEILFSQRDILIDSLNNPDDREIPKALMQEVEELTQNHLQMLFLKAMIGIKKDSSDSMSDYKKYLEKFDIKSSFNRPLMLSRIKNLKSMDSKEKSHLIKEISNLFIKSADKRINNFIFLYKKHGQLIDKYSEKIKTNTFHF